VKVAVEEAVRDFGSAKDFTLWAWYANRIGVNNFLELYFEQKSIMRECRLRNPAAAFHARLKRFYAAITQKGSTARQPASALRVSARQPASALRVSARQGGRS
jgi:hypothetical protein